MKMNEVTQTEASAAGMGMGMMIPAALLAYPIAMLFDKILPGESSKEKKQRIKDEVAQISSDMKKRGFGFFGTTICYAHMQATGIVNDHVYRVLDIMRCKIWI